MQQPNPQDTQISLCETYEAVARAVEELSQQEYLILHCKGLDLGMPDGKLSLIAISNSDASNVVLFDVLALSDPRNPLLSPLFMLLGQADIIKVVWDGRSDFLEIADTYGVLIDGVLDLQLVEVAQRAVLKKKKKGWRIGHTTNHFKSLKSELDENPTALDGIHKLFGLDHCAGLFQVIQGKREKDPSVVRMHKEDGEAMWMKRPLPSALLQHSTHGIEIIAKLWTCFCSMKGYLDDLEGLKQMSARYVRIYPRRELKALHVPLHLNKFLPLDVMTAPPENVRLFHCVRCERMLSLPCFSTTPEVLYDDDGNVGPTGPQRLSICRLCYLLARRNSELSVGEWVDI